MSMTHALNRLVCQSGTCHREIFFVDGNDLAEAVTARVKEQATVVMWQVRGIVWQIYRPMRVNEVINNLQNSLEARIFTGNAELFLQREQNGFRVRFVEDGTGDPVKFVDSFSRFWGKIDQTNIDGEFVHLADKNRKISLTVPFLQDVQNIEYLGLTTRNYIAADKSTGLAGYVDYRFLSVDSADYNGSVSREG